MTNYDTYPIRRLGKNSCIICFPHDKWSWCSLTKESMTYLLNSDYLDGAFQVDIKQGIVMHFTVDEFRWWIQKRLERKEYYYK